MGEIEIQYFADERTIKIILDGNVEQEIKMKTKTFTGVRFTLYKNKIFKGFLSTALHDLRNL